MSNSDKKQTEQRKTDRINRQVVSRTMILMILCGVCAFLGLLAALFNLMVLHHEEYEKKAIRNQTSSIAVRATRGVIYDCNMNILASSYTVQDVYVNPQEIEKAGEDTGLMASRLSEILEVDRDTTLQRILDTDYAYKPIRKKIPQETADKLLEYVNTTGVQGIYMEPSQQRYYPYGSLAAQVLGFVNKDDIGGEGLEAYYETTLEGNSGKVIKTRGNNGTAMLYTYEKYYDASNGNNLVLTIDSTVQYYLEKNLQSAIDRYTIENGGFALVMDVNTGAILGMATLGSFDPNDYLEVYDTAKAEQLEALYQSAIASPKGSEAYTEGLNEYNSKMATARLKQWRNRAVSDGYEPGSTFKLITLASALNENAVTLNDTFYCGGAADFQGRSQTLHCWKHEGHGQQSTAQSLGNSCNIAFANIGLKLGGQKFYDYVNAFGLTESTGVDLPGEGKGYFFSKDLLTGASTASLISASFGQTFKITPLQLVRAVSAIVNGGYLLEPYVVAEVQDSEGNTIEKTEPHILRQVISEQTSATMRTLMEFVVTDGTATAAKTAGYRVGGKTGTSEKIDEYDANGNQVEDKMVSFIGVAPINDPKYAVLVVLDTPSRATGLYIGGGAMAAPTVKDIFTDILPHLGVEPDYGADEISAVNVVVPNVLGMTADETATALKERSLKFRSVGSGETATGQIPAAGASIPGDSEIVVYFGGEAPEETVTVPDFRGMTVSQARDAASYYGLYIQARGTDKISGYIYVTYQGTEPGTEVPRGSTVNVEFTNNSVQD
ncbi:MAG: PASTA domain-containing protein [Oscillospiraceae bacterium]|nr:PASTA domain-containing protein [Oscillospiraceae bacterium]